MHTLCRPRSPLAALLVALAWAAALALPLMPPAHAATKAPAATKAKAATPSGYRIGKAPDWVKPVKASPPSTAPASGGLGYRLLLVDTQTQIGSDSSEQVYTRSVSTATESAGLQI